MLLEAGHAHCTLIASYRERTYILEVRPKFILQLMLMLAEFEGSGEDFGSGLMVVNRVFSSCIVDDRLSFSLHVLLVRALFKRAHSRPGHFLIVLKFATATIIGFERVGCFEFASIHLVLQDHLLQVLALFRRHRLLK